MSENLTPEVTGGEGAEPAPIAPPPPKRGPGHRGQDIRDTMAEMAAKAHEISLEAGSKMASAMRDVIGAAAGISAFAIESARDLVNYMVRRGQMTQEEATKLLKEVEEAHAKRPKSDIAKKSDAPAKPEAKVAKEPVHVAEKPAPPPEKVAAKATEKPAKAPVVKHAERAPAKASAPEKAKAPLKAAPPAKSAPAAKAAAKPVAAKKPSPKKK
ncbi:MAG: hypothetical protein ACT4P7_06835 [Gemmatimonadaceae bacterium]